MKKRSQHAIIDVPGATTLRRSRRILKSYIAH